MTDSTRGLRVIVSLAIILCIVASLSGAAARRDDKNAGVLRIATIDIDRVSSDYKPLKTFKQDVDKRKETVKVQAQTWQQNNLLTEAEQKTLSDLNFKDRTVGGPVLAAAEKTQQTALIEKGRKLAEDFQRLQNTAIGAATEQDKAKLVEYQRLFTETESRVNTLTTQAEAELTNRYNELMAQTQKNLHDSLRTVAKEKQYSLVLTAGVAPFAEYDCTEDVIKLMNK